MNTSKDNNNSKDDGDSKTVSITTSVDMGSYINSTSLVDSLGSGKDNNISQEVEEDIVTTEEEEDDDDFPATQQVSFDDEEIEPTQRCDSIYSFTGGLGCSDSFDESTDSHINQIFNSVNSGSSFYSDNGSDKGENKINFKQLVRLKSTLKRHEIPLRELTVEKEIGQGFFGKVYKAKWRGKSVALKRITLIKFRDLSESDIFDKEVSIMSKLCHPTCVMFIGACSLDGPNNRSIIMEYMEGGSLRKLLDERSSYQLAPSLQLSIARNIAEGMNYLHTNFKEGPIIHRDLTSSNILLNGSYTVAKINDFGLSKEMKPGPSEMTAAMGSLAWMAPECFKAENYTEKVDVYSYAVILWEILTCRDPYNGMEPLRMAFLASVEDYRLPLTNFPIYWSNLIKQCWDPIPSKRPSFIEILQILNQIESNPIYQNLDLTSNNTLIPSKSNENNSSSQTSSQQDYQMKTSRNNSSNMTSSPSKNAGYYAQDITNNDESMQVETKNLTSSAEDSFQAASFTSRKSFLINNNNNNNNTATTMTTNNNNNKNNNNSNNNIIKKLNYISEQDSFLVSYQDNSIVRYYSLESNSLINTLQIEQPVVCMNYQIINEKVFLAVAMQNNSVSIFELQKVEGEVGSILLPIKVFKCGDQHKINGITWNGTSVITGSSRDSTIKVWDVEKSSQTPISTMENGNGIGILSIDSQSHQSLMVSGGEDGKIKLWDIRNAHCFRTLTHSSPTGSNNSNSSLGVDSVLFRSSHQVRDPILLSGSSSDCKFKVWNMYSSTCLDSFQTHSHDLLGIHRNPLTQQIITWSSEGTIALYNGSSGNNNNERDNETVHFSKLLNVNNMMSNEALQSAQLINSKNRIIFSSKSKFYSISV